MSATSTHHNLCHEIAGMISAAVLNPRLAPAFRRGIETDIARILESRGVPAGTPRPGCAEATPRCLAARDSVLADVAKAHGVTTDAILGLSRKSHIARARMVAMAEVRAMGFTLEDVGAAFFRTHGVVLNAMETVNCGSGQDYGICRACGRGHGQVIFRRANAELSSSSELPQNDNDIRN